MNIFVYDSFLSDKKHQNTISKIETRITDLGLSGKIIRLNLLKNHLDSIDGEIKRGAKTIVAVGNNETLNKVVNSVLSSNHPDASKIPIFIIPVGKENNEISLSLGIENYNQACEVLSSRRIEELNAVEINSSYFLSEARIQTMGTKVEVDESFTLEISEQGNIIISNLKIDKQKALKNHQSLPNDDKLELFVGLKKDKEIKSAFMFKTLLVSNKIKKIIIDKSVEITTPAKITLSNKKLKTIVGKNRSF
ncbi:hypothetical protein C0584_05820 [Candidatus Parcubacteria bacterium]|nr:MAG: hypothetical protein C0584_05820 [Candidatus Parcubacteria bacterium]